MGTEGSDMGQALRVIEPTERPSLALDLPATTTFDEWVSIGRRLCLGSQALNWHIGDWWRHGKQHFGEDETRRVALDIWGVEGETARVYGWVAERFDPVTRVTDLSFTHYREAASLPEDQAQELLERASRDHLSTRDIRREVTALKAANDPEPTPQPEVRPSPTLQAEIRKAYEVAVELGEALQNTRQLKRRERFLLEHAYAQIRGISADLRPVPADFEIIFVEKGRLACEDWYRASRLTIDRWLIERGKTRLVEARAEFIKHGRHPKGSGPEPIAQPVDFDRSAIGYRLAQEAADFLRISRYGGWHVSATDDGVWRVGTVRKTCDELVAMAERQGFDSLGTLAALQRDGGGGVEG